ncbi:multidrug effflux MFS transporter [Roseovarius amoyensis]|uniref:multidrug effflux MFS transporter n=1 Tax=Roseovarius amoyensis TaxID=2211448 RepID=UPI000DBE9A6A|nr:multidrug effflux MFS transporter [Roseovarius amoyensis]
MTPPRAGRANGPGPVEFVAMMAMMFATIAFSIDAMLPALHTIGGELVPEDRNEAQLIITTFILGMGLGTFISGPLSDTFGRKPVIVAGAAIYIASAALAWASSSLELILAARLIQGIGAAGPRIVTLAIIRDLYSGREMARLMSFVMIVFTLVPALAPLLGAAIMAAGGWRSIFVSFAVFSAISTLWVMLRLPEPLPRDMRRPFMPGALISAIAEVFSHASVRISILVQALCYGMLFSMLSSVQQVYEISFGRGDSFPAWFGVCAIIAGTSSFLNATLVMRLGMRFLVTTMLAIQIALSCGMIAVLLSGLGGDALFYLFFAWQVGIFYHVGLTIGNLNAMAMEPLGHVAGMAASAIGAASTVLSVLLAVPVGLAFDGTPLPLAIGIEVMAVIAFALMLVLRRLERY